MVSLAQFFTAFEPPAGLKPSEWAERYRVLSEAESATPGPWRNDRVPYLVEIMEVLAGPLVEEVILIKSAQVGGSEALRNVLGYWVDQDSGPCLIVFPDENAVKENMRRKIWPMFRSSPRLERRLTQDLSLGAIYCDSMWIRVGYSGSASSLASDPCRYAILDEIDKFSTTAGKGEGPPVQLAEKRLTTYGHRRRIAKISTPTTKDGLITKEWDSCADRRHWHMPCPECGEYQVLDFDRLRWPEQILGDSEGEEDEPRPVWVERVLAEKLVRYECEHCEHGWTTTDKLQVLPRGRWASEGQRLLPDGSLEGHRIAARKVGFHINAMSSPFVSFEEIAAEWIKADGDPRLEHSFHNNVLGQAYEPRQSKVDDDVFRRKAKLAWRPKIVPAHAPLLLATADTQKDHFWYVVRAWCRDFTSYLIDYGKALDFEDLEARTFGARFDIDGFEHIVLRPRYLIIDTQGGTQLEDGQSRTDQVYRWGKQRPESVIMTKGSSQKNPTLPYRRRASKYTPPGETQAYSVEYVEIDSNYYKDILARRINYDESDPDQREAWHVHSEIEQRWYIHQMTGEHKVREDGRIFWKQKHKSRDNHLFDCEALQCFGAQIANVDTMPNDRETVELRKKAELERRNPKKSKRPDVGWLGERPKWGTPN